MTRLWDSVVNRPPKSYTREPVFDPTHKKEIVGQFERSVPSLLSAEAENRPGAGVVSLVGTRRPAAIVRTGRRFSKAAVLVKPPS
jgi:hypothetical protein